MGFDFKIIYHPGKMNMVADMLFRSRYIATEEEIAKQDQARQNNLIWVKLDDCIALIKKIIRVLQAI